MSVNIKLNVGYKNISVKLDINKIRYFKHPPGCFSNAKLSQIGRW